jgi:hypothetical protein
MDGETMHKASPVTFPIPTDTQRRNVEVGRRVKLGIQSPTGPGERLWVDIESKESTAGACSFIGKMFNNPCFCKGHGIHKGDLIAFGVKHIIDIVPDIDMNET